MEGSCLLSSGVWKREGSCGTQSTYSVGGSRLAGAAFPWVGLQFLHVCCQLTEGKMMERRKKIALELSELVVYCRPVPFDEESKGRGPVAGGGGWEWRCPLWRVQVFCPSKWGLRS